MDTTRRVKISRYLSKHLRHTPERLGITLAPGGWVEVETLLKACAAAQFSVSRAELDQVVANCEKQRFSFDQTGTRIRANQGHSTTVDLQLKPTIPPDVLYHGTAAHAIESILQSGLLKMNRHHVHLSESIDTAKKVGMRHGRPVILKVDTVKMQEEGFLFYRSENGVWLVDRVPPEFLKELE